YGQFVLRPNGQVLGPRLGPDVQEVFAAARSGRWEQNPDGTVAVAGHTLSGTEFELALNPVEGTTAAALRTNDALVALDTAIGPALAAEGIARDVVRLIQAERKNQNLEVTDRITLALTAGSEIINAVRAHQSYVCDQVLAVDLQLEDPEGVDVLLAPSKNALRVDAGRLRIDLAKSE
ncbi:MAG: DUF5915 domain-containing protein, partial [bacterium]|nr:DUF5915 domain-containing protein [bacterium]